MATSISICLIALACLLWLLRRDQQSLGLPFAYLSLLLLNHVPGAIGHVMSINFFDSTATEIGIWYTAVGSMAFLGGVGATHLYAPRARNVVVTNHRKYWYFCLFTGFVATYGLSSAAASLGLNRVLDNAGASWILAVMLGLRGAVYQGSWSRVALWCAILMIYPSTVLLLGGFLSYGSAAITIVLSGLVVFLRSSWRAITGVIVVAFLGFNLFFSYFASRNEIRAAVWGGSDFEQRIDRAAGIFTEFEWFDPTNSAHLMALDQRLNQNHFVGLAAMRLEQGMIPYYGGDTLWNGLINLVPRVFWPNKPEFGGSNHMVAEMTGLVLSENTSWGVGNVMEFYVNFGMPGLIGGFVALGLLLGWLDRRAAVTEARGDLGNVFLYFLPGVGLIQPLGAVAEMIGAAGAALVGAFVLKALWLALDAAFGQVKAGPPGRSIRGRREML